MSVYHVAPRMHRDAILRDGLWANAPEGGYPAGVYVFHDLENAQFFADHMRQMDLDSYGAGDENERDIWHVDAHGLDLLPDPAVTPDDTFQGEYPVPIRSSYTRGPITADRLRLAEAVQG